VAVSTATSVSFTCPLGDETTGVAAYPHAAVMAVLRFEIAHILVRIAVANARCDFTIRHFVGGFQDYGPFMTVVLFHQLS
jgi:hypothetical protein